MGRGSAPIAAVTLVEFINELNIPHYAFYLTIGLAIGAGVVGSSVHRTISVARGDVFGSVSGSIINSITYFFSIYWIAKDNMAAYIGTVIGSTIMVIVMAKRNRNGNKSEQVHSKQM